MADDAYDMAYDLLDYAKQHGFVAPEAYYIVGSFNLRDQDGSSVYSDEAHLWCKPCAEKLLNRARKLMKPRKRMEHFVCFTEAYGEDTCPHCRGCGETLDGTLSANAVSDELSSYAEDPIELGDSINPRQAVEIAQVLFAAPDDPAAIALGKAALAALGQGKDPT